MRLPANIVPFNPAAASDIPQEGGTFSGPFMAQRAENPALATTANFEEIPAERLPVYARAATDLYHSAGKILVPKGQLITPDIVGALSDAGIASVYGGETFPGASEDLEKIDIGAIRGDEPLAWAVFDGEGRLLARQHEKLTIEQLESLHKSGQRQIYRWKARRADEVARFEAALVARMRMRLDEEIVFRRRRQSKTGIPLERLARVFKGRAVASPVRNSFEKFYVRAVGRLHEMYSRLAAASFIRNADIAALVNDIIDRFLDNRELMAALALWQPKLDQWADHCVATAVYSLFAAHKQHYGRRQARDIVAAALFHDVGYLLIPKKLLEAERALSKGERRIIFRHIEHALLLAGRIDWPGDDWLIAIYQHQERGTGAGYPSGYRADRIHPYARILAAADVLHALVSDRPHRPAYPASVAMNMLMKMASAGLLDRTVVRTLARELSLYPVGATVMLSTGELARVLAASREPDRPHLGVILSPDGRRGQKPSAKDLSRLPNISISAETAPFEEPLAGF